MPPIARPAKEAAEKHFLENAKKGIILSTEDLRRFLVKRKMVPPPEKELRDLRHLFKYTAVHSRWVKPTHYMSAAVHKLGNVQVDSGELFKKLLVPNGQHFHLFVAVDSLSQKLAVYTFPNKSQESWQKFTTAIIKNDFPFITSLISDRDSAVSDAFKDRIKKDWNIDWIHLKSRSKSYKAERALRFVKERLAIALKLNEPGDLKWRKHLSGIVEDYNNRYVTGSTMRRKDISKSNQLELLKQLFKTNDPSVLTNLAVYSNLSEKMAARIGFKYKPGQKVILALDASYLVKKKIFKKKSVKGAYTKTVFTIFKRMLKASGKKYLTRCYRLQEITGPYYQSELKPARFAEREEEEDGQ
jgi:hypothetical protein